MRSAAGPLILRPKASAYAMARQELRRAVIAGGLETAAVATRLGLFQGAAGLGLIFMLHHVRPASETAFDPNALLSVTPEYLDAALARLKALGLRAVDLTELPETMCRGDPSDRVFAVTLDDGYRNNFEHALPVFEQHGVPFTVFTTSGFVERRFTLWWETAERLLRVSDNVTLDLGSGTQRFDVRRNAQKAALFQALLPLMTGPAQDVAIKALNLAARASGLDPIGITDELIMTEDDVRKLSQHPLARLEPHTVSHPSLAQVDRPRLIGEINESVERLRAWTGHQPSCFAYPYGDRRAAGRREFAAIQDSGLSLAVTTQPAVLQSKYAASPTALPRVSLNGLFQKSRYVDALVSGLPYGFAGLIRK